MHQRPLYLLLIIVISLMPACAPGPPLVSETPVTTPDAAPAPLPACTRPSVQCETVDALTSEEKTQAARNEALVAVHFEHIKTNTVALTAFLRAMPKGADLHTHLVGAVYGETFLEIAEAQNAYYDVENNEIVMDPALRATIDVAALIPLQGFSPYYYTWLEAVSMRSWTPHRFNGHDHFFNTFAKFSQAYLDKPEAQAAMLADVVRRAELQNIRLLELQHFPVGDALSVLHTTAPANVPDYPSTEAHFDALHAHVQRHRQAFTAQVTAYLDDVTAQAQTLLGYAHPVGHRDNPVYVRFLDAVNRVFDTPKAMFLELAAAAELMQVDARFAGMQIVAPEDWPAARRNFNSHMQVFDQVYRRYGRGLGTDAECGPNIAMHAGELTPQIAPLKDMTFHIRASIDTGHARRIGHGLSIAWEDNPMGLLRQMADDGILVEVCPTSNWSIAGLKEDDHPFRTYMAAGVPLSINTDDEGVSRSNLTLEFVRAVQGWDLDYATVKTLVRNAIAYSFTECRDAEIARLERALFDFDRDWAQRLD